MPKSLPFVCRRHPMAMIDPLLIVIMTAFLCDSAFARQDAETRGEAMKAAAKEIAVADGLFIRQVADDDLVPDCTCIVVGTGGHVVASGPGYLRHLVDADSDGVFESYRTLFAGPERGAHGLCIDEGTLYFVGDGGVWKLDDPFKEDVLKRNAVRVLEIKTGGEHHAHALRRGDDGCWYLIAGNGTQGMFELQNVSEPEISHPRAGAIWRISSDWSEREVWAHGFRNAYDFDFASDRTIDTFDSDGERDVSLPWYRPTRLFRVSKGDDAGWISRSWKRPNSDPQMPQVRAEFGRGSPTGVHRYKHHRLPKRFHHGVFALDWTFGRVLFVADEGSDELVASPKGTAGFAVTDIDETPEGALLVSVGGRRSRGGLFLIDALSPETDTPEPRSNAESERVSPPETTESANVTALRAKLLELRNEPNATVDTEAAARAIAAIQEESSGDTTQYAAMSLLIESLGGLGPGDPKDARGKQQAAAVFDGYRSILRPKLDETLRSTAVEAMLRRLKHEQTTDQLRHELIRCLAVMEPDSDAAFLAIADDLDRESSPMEKLHRLIALTRLPVRRSDAMTERMVAAMLEIPELIQQQGLKTDRNWSPRLGELFLAMEHRDSLLPSRFVANPRFGEASHLVWTEQMDPENLERARQRCLAQSRGEAIEPSVARFIALGPDAVPRGDVYRWLKQPETRSAAWLAIASHAKSSDIPELNKAALSVDAQVRDAAANALRRLGQEVPQRVSDSEAVKQWLAQTDQLLKTPGDSIAGQKLYEERQCNRCHNGKNALGPSLDGVGKRFGVADLFRATVDPNHHLPDRYRPKLILTVDGDLIMGMVVYESVDGLTVQTQDGGTHRINSDDIEEVRVSSVSMMPEGLMQGLNLNDAANLMAYLRSL